MRYITYTWLLGKADFATHSVHGYGVRVKEQFIFVVIVGSKD